MNSISKRYSSSTQKRLSIKLEFSKLSVNPSVACGSLLVAPS
jgi:hypothetical protein